MLSYKLQGFEKTKFMSMRKRAAPTDNLWETFNNQCSVKRQVHFKKEVGVILPACHYDLEPEETKCTNDDGKCNVNKNDTDITNGEKGVEQQPETLCKDCCCRTRELEDRILNMSNMVSSLLGQIHVLNGELRHRRGVRNYDSYFL